MGDNSTAGMSARTSNLHTQIVIKAHQEESHGYPTQLVPSGASYQELKISDHTAVYEFRSTEPYDPRNCRISLPPITEEVFGVEESSGSYDNTAISNIRDRPLAKSLQVEPSDTEVVEESNNRNMHKKL